MRSFSDDHSYKGLQPILHQLHNAIAFANRMAAEWNIVMCAIYLEYGISVYGGWARGVFIMASARTGSRVRERLHYYCSWNPFVLVPRVSRREATIKCARVNFGEKWKRKVSYYKLNKVFLKKADNMADGCDGVYGWELQPLMAPRNSSRTRKNHKKWNGFE